MFYYAYINANNICENVYAMPSQIPVAGYIEITEEQYTSRSVVGKLYDAETNTWVDPPAFSCNTDEVQYKETGTTLSSKLDAMDTAIEEAADAAEAAETAAATAAEAAHTHSNKTVLDGITAEKVAAWDAAGSGSGTPGTPGTDGADGEDGEDGATFIPSVSADGIISWTNNKGLANPTAVNIMGPQGATGPQGPAGADGADGADGQDGANGITPHIGTNGHWYIGETDTGVSAQGPAGADGADGEDGAAGTEITAAQILSKLIGIDGSGSGLDADKLDGYDSSAFATAGHSHSEYAPSSHYHNEYAESNHSHSDYLPTSGGTVSGNLNVTGILRVNGQQAVYDSGTMVTLSTNNRKTMIAGSEIYSKVTISVSSDRRLKENIKEVSADDMTKFINGLDIKSFNYIGNDEPCIGVIAQEVIEADPEMAKCFVRQDEKGYYSVKAADLVFPLIATVQKLAAEVEELKNR